MICGIWRPYRIRPGKWMVRAGAALGFCLLQSSAFAQVPASTEVGAAGVGAVKDAGAVLTFTLDRGGPAPEHYSLQLDETTGKGTYRGSATAPSAQAGSASDPGAGPEGAPVAVSDAVLKKMFAAAPLVRSNRCASHRKGIAQTGVKTLQLTENGTISQCSYNYSDEDRVNTATAAFQGVAATMEYGARLASELRFDRLGLDAEMDVLESALADGRALEVRNIGPVLVAQEEDDRVMERVRRRAAHLLQGAGLPAAAVPGGEGR